MSKINHIPSTYEYFKIASFIFNRSGCFIVDFPIDNHSDTDDNYTDGDKVAIIGAFLTNLSNIGYFVSEEVITQLRKRPMSELITLILPTLLRVAKNSIGADKTYNLYYPRFPAQVMEMSDAESFISAYLHYIGLCDEWSPRRVKEEDDILVKYIDNKPKRKIGYKPSTFVLDTFKEVVNSPISISKAEKEFIGIMIMDAFSVSTTYFTSSDELLNSILCNIKSREIAAYCAAEVFKQPVYTSNDNTMACLQHILIKTPTDALRMYCALSDGDISLATPTKFININKTQTRCFLRIVSEVITDETKVMFKQYDERWKRLFERLHPCSKIYDNVPNIDKLRRGVLPALYRGDWSAIPSSFDTLLVMAVEDAKRTQKVDPIIRLFDKHKDKKTVYARHLEHFIRLFYESDKEKKGRISDKKWWVIFKYFKTNIVDDIPSYVCIQMMNHFKIESSSDNTNNPRVFFIKSEEKTKIWCDYSSKNEKLSSNCYNMIIHTLKESLERRYSDGETKLGLYYVDPKMYDYIIPLGNRGKTFNNKNVERGSKISYGEDVKYITPYIWWTNNISNDKTDIDLSAIFIRDDELMDNNGTCKYKWLTSRQFVSFSNKRLSCVDSQNDYIALHSGDIVDGGPINGDGVSEMIQIDVEKARKDGYRYVIIGAYLYACQNHNEQSFRNTNMTMGVMTDTDKRDMNKMVTKYDANKVEFNFQPNSNSTKIIPMIIDLVNRQFIWSDMAVGSINTACNRVESSAIDIDSVIHQTINNSMKLSIGEFLELYACMDAGNIPVTDRESADITFGLEEGDITPFNFSSLQLI